MLSISEKNLKIKEILPNVTITDEYRYKVKTKNRTKCICICKNDNHVWECDWNNLNSGKGCPICGEKNRRKKKTIPLDEKQAIISKLNPNIKLLEHIEGTKKYKCKCSKDDYEWSATWGSLSNGFGCPVCANVKKNTLEEARQEFINKGYIPKFEEIKNNKQKLLAETKDGYKVFFSLVSLRRNKDNIFSNRNPYAIENIKLWLKLNKLDGYKILSSEYLGNKSLLDWECPKSHKFKMRWGNFTTGNRCPICNESKGEELVKKCLEENNIEFIREHKFPKCRFKRPLPFDFYLPQYNMCIEFDGEFHYQKTRLKNNLELQRARDKIKDEYCKNNNIKLLRIPYWEKENINNILKENI